MQDRRASHLITITFLVVGIAIAAASWVPSLQCFNGQLGLVWLMPLAWLICSDRKSSFLLVFGYYLVVERDIPQVITSYTDLPIWVSVIVIAVHVALMAGLWCAAWSANPLQRPLRLFLVLVLTTVPPVATISLGSPLLAAGWLFPASKTSGLALVFASWCMCYACIALVLDWYRQRRNHWSRRQWSASWPVIAVFIIPTTLLVIACVCISLNMQLRAKPLPVGWKALDTKLGRFPVELEARYKRQIQLTQLVDDAFADGQTSLAMLPEEIAGPWEPRYEWMWRALSARHPGKTIIVGFDVAEGSGGQFSDRAIHLLDGQVVGSVAARIPVPIGSWRPWSDAHAPMHLWGGGQLRIDGKVAATFFCYEELLLWPWLVAQNQAADNEIALVFVNHWFAGQTAIGDAQAQSSRSWARLFNWTLLRAVNSFDDHEHVQHAANAQ